MGSGIKSKTAKARLANFFRWILIIFFAAYTLFPLLWLVISSFKTNYEFLAESPFSLPQVWQVENYVKALEVAGLGRMLLNSVVVGLVATLINVVIASMSGYCISRFNFRGKEKMFLLFTIGILVPLNALMVPYFIIINKLGLYNTYGGLILLWYHKLLALRGRRLFSGPGGYRGHGGSSPKQEDRSGNGLRLPSFPGGDGLSGEQEPRRDFQVFHNGGQHGGQGKTVYRHLPCFQMQKAQPGDSGREHKTGA